MSDRLAVAKGSAKVNSLILVRFAGSAGSKSLHFSKCSIRLDKDNSRTDVLVKDDCPLANNLDSHLED